MGFLDFLFRRNPKPDDFAQMVMQAIQDAGGLGNLHYDASQFCLRTDGKGTMYLHNVYSEYCQAPRGARKGVLTRFASVSQVQQRDWTLDQALPHLMPRIRDRSYYGFLDLQLKLESEKRARFPLHDFAGFLAVAVVIDMPECVVEMQTDSLEEWKVPLEYLHETARRNLARISDGAFKEAAPGVWVSPWQDDHDASRVLLVEVIKRLQVKGRHVAFIPAPRMLLITGSEDVDGLQVGFALTQKALEAPRSITGRPLVLHGETWQPLSVLPDHPLAAPLSEMQALNALRDYGEQKKLLVALMEKHDEDVYVADVRGMRPRSGFAWTYCVWSRDVVSLLPRSDFIALVSAPEQEELLMVPWEEVEKVAGGLLVPEPDLYPPRFRVTAFPTEDQLAALRPYNRPAE